MQSDHLQDKDHFYVASLCELMRKVGLTYAWTQRRSARH